MVSVDLNYPAARVRWRQAYSINSITDSRSRVGTQVPVLRNRLHVKCEKFLVLEPNQCMAPRSFTVHYPLRLYTHSVSRTTSANTERNTRRWSDQTEEAPILSDILMCNNLKERGCQKT